MLVQLHQNVRNQANPEKAKFLQRFFKTNKGEYAQGDICWGLTVPQSRIIAKRYAKLSLSDLSNLIKSRIHEERFIALIIAVNQYKQGTEEHKKILYTWYLDNLSMINNWDLVDVSAASIVGDYLEGKSISPLEKLAKSNNVWERRIAIIATFHFIKLGSSHEAIRIATLLLHDSHDLIHKAVGWMLREIGKRCSQKILEQFLDSYAATMPRTTLRYAIEHFPDMKRKHYLSQKKSVTSV